MRSSFWISKRFRIERLCKTRFVLTDRFNGLFAPFDDQQNQLPSRVISRASDVSVEIPFEMMSSVIRSR